MLTQTKSGLFVICVVAAFSIISLAIGTLSPNTLALDNGEQPAHSTAKQAAGPRVSTAAQPAMGETVREASLNWADYTEPAPEPIIEQPPMGETLYQASLNWADFAKKTTLPMPAPNTANGNQPY